uniref:Uncharacterized protein n=1 Tax=Arundo donax TaxID=35708 RepID=A0A0A9SER7_ARUDO
MHCCCCDTDLASDVVKDGVLTSEDHYVLFIHASSSAGISLIVISPS